MTSEQHGDVIEQELLRLRLLLKTEPTPDPVDVAAVEALASTEVRSLLAPILESGAVLCGLTMDAAGSMEGVVKFTFETKPKPGASQLSYPPRVSALVAVSPPKVLRAVIVEPGATTSAQSFTLPTGPRPVALLSIGIPTPTQVLEFQREAARSLMEWLQRSGLRGARELIRAQEDIPEMLAGPGGLTTGTKCCSALCIEHTSDDFD